MKSSAGKSPLARSRPTGRLTCGCFWLIAAGCSPEPPWRPHRNVKQTAADIFNWVRTHEKELRPLV